MTNGDWADHKRSKYFSELCPENTVGHQGWTGTLTVIDRESRLVIVVLTSKRNTAICDPTDPNCVNTFDGIFYTTSQLGFVSRIVYDALNERDCTDTMDVLEKVLIDQTEKTPYPAAFKALDSFREARSEFFGK